MQADEKHAEANCASCGQLLYGKYCSACGEKVLHEEDRSIKHFFEEFFHVLTHADSKFLRTLKCLITKPGFLTREYVAGRRKLYTAPLSLFFIINLAYLFIGPVDALNSKYMSQAYGQPYSSQIFAQVQHKMDQREWTEKEMEEHYNRTGKKVSKLMMIAFVFLFTLPLSVLFYKPGRYYADHVVFATEFINYLILVLLIIIPYLLTGIYMLLVYSFEQRINADINSMPALAITFVALTTYLFVATKRTYRARWILPRAVLLTLSIAPITIAYRFLLFQVTMLFL